MSMHLGLYEKLITKLIADSLDEERFFVGQRQLEKTEAATFLTRFLSRLVELAIDSVPNSDNRVFDQVQLANSLVKWLGEHIDDDTLISDNLIDSQGRILTALLDSENPIAANLSDHISKIQPSTGLSQSELFCGSNVGVPLDSEIKREIQSSDTIYWLVSFIKWSGLRIFYKALEDFTRSGKKLKVITTSYMGATDLVAIEKLAQLPNTEIKLSYNSQRERLHAKSYLFVRNTGFHTGYIGSSNLSNSALTSGLEWNLKITSQEIPHIIEKSLNTFETYWESNDFEFFTNDEQSSDKLKNALQEARGQYTTAQPQYYFDIKPHSHQLEILETLKAERELHGRFKNLVVAATGTGKTVISAFDFARFYRQNPQSSFLFLAHREEILKQAIGAYRGVLKDSQFGELWVGTNQPAKLKHVFSSIQKMNNYLSSTNQETTLSADYYDYIVIDEVHHAAASSYRKVLSAFEPQILLGLTATPERHDGANILDDFCGISAAEIRLPDAINQRHLCPFQYFSIDDETDLTNVKWTNGKYDINELTNVYTQNDQRLNSILLNLNNIVTDVSQRRALGFCVSKKHAEFMATNFNAKGIKSDFLTSDNSADRSQLLQRLISRDINILFVVDMFNEGVDIPELDTLLMLRPTESLTVFLQQLGRGLRLTDDKECCTVLDFVGNSNVNYDFTHKFRALIGKTNQSLKNEIEQDFPHVPLGCRIELHKVAQDRILRSISQAIPNANRLISKITNFQNDSSLELNMMNFLSIHSNIILEDLYKPHQASIGGWEALKTRAANSVMEDDEKPIYKAYYRAIKNRFLQNTSFSYLTALKVLCESNFEVNALTQRGFSDEEVHQYSLMCHYDFWNKAGPKLGFTTLQKSLAAIKHDSLQQELSEVLDLVLGRLHTNEFSMPKTGNDVIDKACVKMHARYTKEQILIAFEATRFDYQNPTQEGVVSIDDGNAELFFVTLNKNEQQFTTTTMYHDYAINENLFHWQSQNASHAGTGRGKGYVEQRQNGKTFVLFVREQSKDKYGKAMGFVNYGPVDFVKYEGERPMSITWKLKHPMPAFMWRDAAKLAVG